MGMYGAVKPIPYIYPTFRISPCGRIFIQPSQVTESES